MFFLDSLIEGYELKVRERDVVFKDKKNLEEKMDEIENQSRLYMFSGSIVKTASATSVVVHSWAEIQTLFKNAYGFTPTDMTVIGVTYTNGDGAATGTHVQGCTILNNNFYAVFDRSVSGAIRINYAYFCNH